MNSSMPWIGMAILTLRVRPGDRVVRLIPAGEFHAPRGAMSGTGPWVLSVQAARRIIASNSVRQAHIVVDYEHQQIASATNGQPSPAAGWVDPQSLSWVENGPEPGLYGAVTWTAKAAAMIAADEYRYLSPVFPYDVTTGEPTDLLHVALTNTPAIDHASVASLSAVAVAPSLSVDDQRGIHHFNRNFGPLGVLHPETARLVAALGVGRDAYLVSIGARV